MNIDIDAVEKTITRKFAECIGIEDLKAKLQNKSELTCYNGYEPSGRLHLAAAIPQILNFNYLCGLGIKCKILLADVFALNNNKLDGDFAKIAKSAQDIKDIFYRYGLDRRVKFVLASEEIAKDPTKYWNLVMQISREVTTNRILRCGQIMGRKDSDNLKASQFLYPIMQCADIFYYANDNSTMICSLGVDQRKVNMLAREIAPVLGKNSPIILSHAMLPGLKKGQEKMSKSDESSAIFMSDDKAAIEMKIKKAYCPERTVESNPILVYFAHIIFPWFQSIEVELCSPSTILHINSFENLVENYSKNFITPQILKACFIKYVCKILQL